MRLTRDTKSKIVDTIDLDLCLAKSLKLPDGKITPGRSVFSHCKIVGDVAGSMIQRMPTFLRDDLFPPGSELIAAAHDIGKVSPTFQKKIYSALTKKNNFVLNHLLSVNSKSEQEWGGHAGVSQITTKYINVGKYIPEIIGQHHGKSPILSQKIADDEVFGGPSWNKNRILLLDRLKQNFGCNFPIVKTFSQARVLAGLVSVADWIGSGSAFDIIDDDCKEKIERCLDAAGFMRPIVKPGMNFSDVFGFQPRDTQTSLIDSVMGPGVYVLEAPMALGKTEAALFAAYRMLEQNMATGIYFALPTQLTSDKIYDRVNQFLKNILQDDSPHKQSLLAHGNAWLSYFDLGGEEANPDGAWFSNHKREILAPFAVGTIDQALMAVMNVKHGFVRTFGLAGKVVILDEVHSYDSFTGTILDALVKTLREIHCTVIILSATLTKERREKLLNIKAESFLYPLVTACPNGGPQSEIISEKIPDNLVFIKKSNKENAIEEALYRAEIGYQVLWIENTVYDAQLVYKKIASQAAGINIECGILHSRFIKKDRTDNESYWVDLFGKNNTKRNSCGRILVGTQVLEQSLDIDADFLITAMAPTDMLLQRIGRLWRHGSTIRPVDAKREAWILSPELDVAISNPTEAFGNTVKVYAPYVLCRSLAALEKRCSIEIPGDIRQLIEETYGVQQESNIMKEHFKKMLLKKEKLERMALVGMSKIDKTVSDYNAQTRYSDICHVNVLLLKKLEIKHDIAIVTFMDGTTLHLPQNARSLNRYEWRKAAACFLINTLNVAEYSAPKPTNRKEVEWLKDYMYIGKPNFENSLIRIALVDDEDNLKHIQGINVNDSYKLIYNSKLGYQSIKTVKPTEMEMM